MTQFIERKVPPTDARVLGKLAGRVGKEPLALVVVGGADHLLATVLAVIPCEAQLTLALSLVTNGITLQATLNVGTAESFKWHCARWKKKQ